MADIFKMLIHAFADIDHTNFTAPLFRHNDSIALRPAGSAEARHCHRDDVFGRQIHPANSQRTDHHGQGRIHSSRDADHAVIQPSIFHTLHKA